MCIEESLSLYKSIGIRRGARIKLINEPDILFSSLENNLYGYSFSKHLSEPVDLIHLFTKSKKELSVELPSLLKYLKSDGILVITWPKDPERFVSDLDFEYVNSFGIKLGLIKGDSYYLENNWPTLLFTNGTRNKNG